MSTLSTSWSRRTGVLLGLCVVISLGSPGFGPGAATAQDQQCWTSEPSMEPGYPQWPEAPQMVIDPDSTYVATMETNRGDIVIELAASEAPVSVNNFVCLARAEYYDVTVFHRIIAGFMIQGGDPTGTGAGGPGYQFNDELPADDAPYVRGTLAMANAGQNTNGSQFFIVQADQPAEFPPNYSIFGQVTDGLDVLDVIAQIPVGPNPASGEPSSPQVTLGIQSITIEEGGLPMAAQAGEDSPPASLATPTDATTPASATPTGEATASVEEPELVADGEDDDAGLTTWVVGGAIVAALAALALGLYRRSHNHTGA